MGYFKLSTSAEPAVEAPCVSTNRQRRAEAAAVLHFPAVHSRPCLPLMLAVFWIPLSCPIKTNQSKVNPKTEKLFNFWPAQLPELVCDEPEEGLQPLG